MKYAYIDANGRAKTAINDLTITVIPEGAKVLTNAEWDNRFNLRFVDGAWLNDPVVPDANAEAEFLASDARDKRNRLLRDTDWAMLPDNPLTSGQQVMYANYRAALRNITNQSGFPTQIEWPALH